MIEIFELVDDALKSRGAVGGADERHVRLDGAREACGRIGPASISEGGTDDGKTSDDTEEVS